VRAFALIIVLASVTGALLAPRSVAPPYVVPVAEQRVVYVSSDYSIYTMLSDGTSRDRITSGAPVGGVLAQPLLQDAPRYTWPTWSPDGTRLVASRFSDLGRGVVAALSLIEPPSSKEEALHLSRRAPVDRVADGTFHFPLWSPNGEQLALIAPNEQGSALLLSVGDLQGASVPVTAGAPIYFTWSPDSALMAIHHRESLLFRDREGQLFDTGRQSVRYRVPSISADSATLAYVGDLGDGDQLIARRIATGDERELAAVPTDAAFAFSPADPDLLALTTRSDQLATSYNSVSLVNVASDEVREVRKVYDGTVFGFWWSPDGTKIAVVGTGPDSFIWVVVDVVTGEATTLAGFIPSQEFTTYIQFFDQFALSQQIWSADSTAITFAGKRVVDGEQAPDDIAWVLDATGEREPTALAESKLAFFVPAREE
jgi:dipeptidyl aminopeptidase/acylaminoacyl peptidase